MTVQCSDSLRKAIERDGFALVSRVFSADRVQSILTQLERHLQQQPTEAGIRSDAGNVYAARNVLHLWPPAADVWRHPPLPALLTEILGAGFGLVRVLYFDKPPERTWSLPWHKDLIIAVADNRRPSRLFAKPTRKAGIPHAEAPTAVLEQMLTARIHLDEVTEENGPLKIIPGSQRTGKEMLIDNTRPETVLAGLGDVLLMRPLVAHSSGRSHPNTCRHRRVLHLEFAAAEPLPDGYAWHTFVGS